MRWRVDVGFDPRTMSRPIVWVDDASGIVRRGAEQVRHVAAAAYLRNPVLDPEPQRFDLEDLGDPPSALRSPRFDVRQCTDPGTLGSCVLTPVAPTAAGDFVFEAPQSDADHRRGDDLFAAASVAVHAQRYAAFAQDHGLPLAPCVAEGAAGILVANYRGFTGQGEIPVANAGYTGDCSLLAFFGQGPSADWGYDADVVTHELAHGTIAAQMGEGRVLGLTRRRSDAVVEDAGAINEALADFVAAVVTGDPGHAEYVKARDGGPMRDADNDLRCPGDLVGVIHFDAEPLTGALWEAYTTLGEDLVQPALDAVALLEEDATFEETAAALLELTDAAMGSDARETLAAALERHNLLDCERVASLEDVRGPLWLQPRFGPGGYFTPMRPPPLQIRVDVPADAVAMTVTFAITVIPDPGWQPVGDVHVLLNAGSPVDFAYSVNAEDEATVDADPDLHLPSVNEGAFTVDVAPGVPMHLVFFNQGLHRTSVHDFAVAFEQAAGTDTGSDADSDSDSESGTGDAGQGSSGPSGADAPPGGCRLGGHGAPLGLLLFAVSARRRRPGR